MNVTSEVAPLTINETDLLTFLLSFASTNNYSIAAWQLPEKRFRLILLARKVVPVKKDQTLEEMDSGFIFAPFDRDAQALFLPAELQFRLSDEKLSPALNATENHSLEWLKQNYNERSDAASSAYHTVPIHPHSESGDYIDVVKKGLDQIAAGVFEKIVPSRTKTVQLPSNFDLVPAFLKLCKAYPQAFVSMISSPETGTWIGASPEELVRVEDKTIFRTVALAGTQPYHEGINLKKVAWTQKEIEEQALVERYIISCFKKIRLREYDEHGPKTIIAGNLMHLKSEFTVNMKETNFPQLASTMLALLHPTSAVCGVPLEPSLRFLKENEGYPRSFYSGYIGPVNIDNQIDIFVNLRCMHLSGGKAVFFAGAGVTADSVPEQEWEETEMKMNTLLRVIQH
jgi:isochorismate synthase